MADLGRGLDAASAEIVECDGLVLSPGLVDMHTHLREPGFEQKETVETGTRAAAVGGYTAVAPMANTDPVADDASVIAEVRAAAARADLADVFPVGAITKGLAGESLAEVGEMVAAGVRVFSDDGRCVPTARTLRNALTYARAFDDVVVAEHCEDASLSTGQQMHEGSARTRWVSRGSRPPPSMRSCSATSRWPASPEAGCMSATSRRRDLWRSCGGEGGRAARHRRGHAAPPRFHRRGSPYLRHEPEGQPPAALGRGPGRAPAGARGRHDRCDRHRSRAARGGGERGGVRWCATRDDRPRNRARGGVDGARRARPPSPVAGRRGDVVLAGAYPRCEGARRSHRGRAPGQPRGSSIPRSDGPSSHRSCRGRGTAPSREERWSVVFGTRCDAGSSRSRRGRRLGDGAGRGPGPRGRHRLPRDRGSGRKERRSVKPSSTPG